jgi:tetratricopeptide (TPR) repeat protein
VIDTKTLSEHERRHWLAIVEHALEKNPGVLSLMYDRAAVLRSFGEFAQAEEAYRVLLAHDPSNFAGLIELSWILVHQARYVEALEIRGALLRHHPEDATALAYFADMLLISGEVDSAASFYERARSLAPQHILVHRGLAEVMRRRGLPEAAAMHEAAASPDQQWFPRQYRGDGKAVPLLLMVSEREDCESPYADRVLDDTTFLVTKCIVERVVPDNVLPEHALVFNGIGDADRCRFALEQLEQVLTRSTAPVINAPRCLSATGRVAMAQRLANIAGIRVPKMLELSHEAASKETAVAFLQSRGFAFPLLVRIADYHAGRYFEKIDTAKAFASVIESFPPLPVLVIEYIDVRRSEEPFHKGRVMVIDGELYPTHLAYGSDWKLHYFSSNMMHEPALCELEARFLAEPQAVMGERRWNAMRRIAEEVKLEYFGIDFALLPDGDLFVFECNAAMVVAKPGVQAQWAYRHPAYHAAMAAADRMVKRYMRTEALV